jgi:hypothetical protein
MQVDGETVTIDRTAPDLVRTIIADGQTITIDTTREGVRTLTVDGTEITIDRTEEANLESFLAQFTGAAAAYSLRDLAGSGNTTVVRVRRTSDNAEADFSATEVSNGTLVAWVGTGNDGFVETWYDQSGNGNDASQFTASKQPKIVDAGSLVTGGLDFDGVADVLETSLVPPNVATLIGVANWDVVDITGIIIGARDSPTQRSYISHAGSIGKTLLGVSDDTLSGPTTVAGDDYLLFGTYSGSTRLLSTNGSVVSASDGSSPNNTIQGYSIGALNTAGANSAFMAGTIGELIVYNSDQSANREAIEANINNQYDIY